LGGRLWLIWITDNQKVHDTVLWEPPVEVITPCVTKVAIDDCFQLNNDFSRDIFLVGVPEENVVPNLTPIPTVMGIRLVQTDAPEIVSAYIGNQVLSNGGLNRPLETVVIPTVLPNQVAHLEGIHQPLVMLCERVRDNFYH
jgi:hypothetical protein